MFFWFLGISGIIMGVTFGQAVINGTQGHLDTGRKFVLETFLSRNVVTTASACFAETWKMEACMGDAKEAHDGIVRLTGQPLLDATKLQARRSNKKSGLVGYGLGMRASNGETLWTRKYNRLTRIPTTTAAKVNTHNDLARSTWSMAGKGNKFFISYNIEKDWFSDNETVGKQMAAKIARSYANVIGVAFSTDGTRGGKTVYWEYGEDTATELTGSNTNDLFQGRAANTGKGFNTDWKQITPGRGTKESPVITVVYEF